ncbi:MAG: CAP domain-containing protein [Bacteroidetes bacterium]|nr:CAP domain-containing protein [Bacteroidota bacterium]
MAPTLQQNSLFSACILGFYMDILRHVRRLLYAVACLLAGFGAAHSVQAQGKMDLGTAVFNKLNEVRDSLHLPRFQRDAALDKAALMQAEWCTNQDSLMHDQLGKRSTNSVTNRVALSRGTHNGLAENVMFIHPTPKLTASEWGAHAADHTMFDKALAANLANPDHRFVGIGVYFQKKTMRLTVCQVFATAVWVPPAKVKLNRHAFGIRPKEDKICKSCDKHPGLQVDFTYGWGTEPPKKDNATKTKLAFFHRLYTMPKDLLKKPNGKVAPDIVYRAQFPCDGPNQLHGSPYHDGYLRRPHGWGFMALRHNRPTKKKDKSLLVNTHSLQVMDPDSFQINTVITKKGRYCKYGIPFSILQQHLGPFDYEFAPDTIPFGLQQQWRRKQLTFKVPFQKGLAKPDSLSLIPLLDSLRQPGAEIVSVRIRGYASVEGTLEINQDLYNRRAKSILDRIQQLQKQTVRMTSSAAENWPDFRKDIKGTKWAKLLKRSNEQIRDTLTKDKVLLAALEPILSKHRYASVEIDLRFELDNSINNSKLSDSLRNALTANNYAAAHAVQSEMWRRMDNGTYSADTILGFYFPRVEGCLPMIHNQYCLKERLGKGFQDDTSDRIAAISKTYPWFQARLLLAMSIAANRPLLCVPFPTWLLRKIQDLKKRKVPEELTRKMELNYYTGLAWYQSQQGELDRKLLKEVQSRYAADSLNAEKAYHLGMYFNRCRAVDATVTLIRPFMKPGLYTEDLVFLYAWSAAYTREMVSEDEWLGWMEKAHAMNPERWRALVDRDWQLLRWERLKGLYCQ